MSLNGVTAKLSAGLVVNIILVQGRPSGRSLFLGGNHALGYSFFSTGDSLFLGGD